MELREILRMVDQGRLSEEELFRVLYAVWRKLGWKKAMKYVESMGVADLIIDRVLGPSEPRG